MYEYIHLRCINKTYLHVCRIYVNIAHCLTNFNYRQHNKAVMSNSNIKYLKTHTHTHTQFKRQPLPPWSSLESCPGPICSPRMSWAFSVRTHRDFRWRVATNAKVNKSCMTLDYFVLLPK